MFGCLLVGFCLYPINGWTNQAQILSDNSQQEKPRPVVILKIASKLLEIVRKENMKIRKIVFFPGSVKTIVFRWFQGVSGYWAPSSLLERKTIKHPMGKFLYMPLAVNLWRLFILVAYLVEIIILKLNMHEYAKI